MATAADDEHWMRLALEQALAGAAAGEVPVGAVLVRDGELLASAYNQPIGAHDPTAHAEIQVLRQAAARAGNYRLPGSTLYVTIEPCAMCAGAIVLARIPRLVFGADDPKAGACGSVLNVVEEPRLNHRVTPEGGHLYPECSEILKAFFRERRGSR